MPGYPDDDPSIEDSLTINIFIHLFDDPSSVGQEFAIGTNLSIKRERDNMTGEPTSESLWIGRQMLTATGETDDSLVRSSGEIM